MIAKTKAMVEQMMPGSRVVYGDSVAGYTPCIVRANGYVAVTTFELLANNYGNCAWMEMESGKESCELRGVDVWSDLGWTPMERVIRHRACKPMVRVVTHTGVVDVTADHSLLRPDGTPVSPSQVTIGEALMHANLPELEHNPMASPISPDEARVLGFFFGDGSAGVYQCPSGPKASWALNNSDMLLLEEYKALCQAVYPAYDWRIMPTLDSSGVYKLAPRGGGYGSVVALTTTYRQRMYSGRSKIIPMEILTANKAVREAFLRGMYDADGDKAPGRYSIDQKSQLSAAHIYLLASSLGFQTSVNSRADKPDIFRMIISRTCSLRKPADIIKKVYPIDSCDTDYVYDVTTANHHFSAGIGRLVVHNTDSVMCILDLGADNRQNMTAHFEAAAKLASDISATFPPPVELEFEKVRVSNTRRVHWCCGLRSGCQTCWRTVRAASCCGWCAGCGASFCGHCTAS